MNSSKLAHAIRNNRIVKRIILYTPVDIATWLNNVGAPKLALKVIHLPKRIYPRNADVLTARLNAHKRLGNRAMHNKLVAERARHMADKYVKIKDYENILALMAQLEKVQQPLQLAAGKCIARQLDSEVGRSRILKASSRALEKYPASIFLLHINSLCRSMAGDYRAASDALIARITSTSSENIKFTRRQSIMLRDSWRVVDLIAREKMDWLEESGDYKNLISKPEDAPSDNSVAISENEIAHDVPGTTARPDDLIDFKEHALQGRLRDEYLRVCTKEFDDAKNMHGRLKAITEMLRAGIRHIPDYTSSYDLAREKLESLIPQLHEMTACVPKTCKKPVERVLNVCTFLNLAHRLGLTEERKRCVEHLVELSKTKSFAACLWPAVGELAKHPEDMADANLIVLRIKQHIPKNGRDLRNFLRWATNSGEYQEADKLRPLLAKHLLRSEAMLGYVNILQRQGRFEDAMRLTRDIHGELLSRPSTTNCFTNFRLIKRVGELDFLIKTARIFSSVPQPKDPRGVVIISPRNIDHLRRYPLLVLVEMKRRGWAVVPIVEGLLPRELTGIAEIDVMNSSIRPNLSLSTRAEFTMPEIENFECDPENQMLKWGDLDFSHSLWEDAAINRRRYSINYRCPELINYLSGLGGWTRVMARVLNYAHIEHLRSDRPTACISLFNNRLPDSLFNKFCQEHGSETGFFHLHAANGYQNYFTNFSTNISERFVLRNMTRAKDVRSASFPIPENFERYYAGRAEQAPEILKNFEDVTKVKRSTGSSKERPAEAVALVEKIEGWRKAGGKVACAFGKVVCDSGVPFDGGPAHSSMRDWINHSIRAVQGSDTLLLIKPHPHEINNQIATFPTEYFIDLLEEPLGENAVFMGHRWFDIHDMKELVDLGLIYNGTTTVELGLLGIPCVLAGHFAPIDYPVGHVSPKDRNEYEAYLRFEKSVEVAKDIRERSAVWLDYMSDENFTQPYRYHARPVTNQVLYPPWWVKEDLKRYNEEGDTAVMELVGRALGERGEPGDNTDYRLDELTLDESETEAAGNLYPGMIDSAGD